MELPSNEHEYKLSPEVQKILDKHQKYGVEDYLRMFIPELKGRLKRLLALTIAMRNSADAESQRFMEKYEPNPVAADFGYDPIPDEILLNEQIETVMFANIAVAIDAEKENYIIHVCKDLGLRFQNKKGEPSFGVAIGSIQDAVDDKILSLPGAKGHERARMLANCFKHNAWKVSEEAKPELGGEVGDDIAYEKEDWAKMIDDTGLVLEEIVRRLKV